MYLRNLMDMRMEIYHTEEVVSTNITSTNRPSIKNEKMNDILLNSMGVGTLGRIALFVKHSAKVVVDGCISVIRGKDKMHGLYLYQSISRREKEIINLSQGSTGQTTLKTDDIAGLKLVKPSNNILKLFYESIEVFYKRKHLNNEEIKVLIGLRDTLLPKLISGELRIPDAERFLEEAGI